MTSHITHNENAFQFLDEFRNDEILQKIIAKELKFIATLSTLTMLVRKPSMLVNVVYGIPLNIFLNTSHRICFKYL